MPAVTHFQATRNEASQNLQPSSRSHASEALYYFVRTCTYMRTYFVRMHLTSDQETNSLSLSRGCNRYKTRRDEKPRQFAFAFISFL